MNSQSQNSNTDLSGRSISNDAAKPYYRQVSRAAFIGLVVNLILGAVKLIGGILASSFALISDAVNSLGDVLTSSVVLIALQFAQKPPDAKHPYGHTRAEAIAGLSVALLVMVSAFWVAIEAFSRFRLQHELPPQWTLWIAGGNVIIKESLYHYKIRVAKKTGSSAIMAHAWDHRADAFSALAALVGLSVVRFAGTEYIWADDVAALVIVGAILFSALKLFRETASELMDAQAAPEFLTQVRDDALGIPGVLGVETLWIRKSGLEHLADIHIEVDPNIPVRDGHTISHVLREELLKKHASLRDILVHIEPFGE